VGRHLSARSNVGNGVRHRYLSIQAAARGSQRLHLNTCKHICGGSNPFVGNVQVSFRHSGVRSVSFGGLF
jgi:hypothetical protein